MTAALDHLDDRIAKLEAVRDSRVIVLFWPDHHKAAKSIDLDDVLPLHTCLLRIGPVERLDVVLHAGGGNLSAAYRIATRLRAAADELSILVPFRARSAGTLLALGGRTIVMGQLGELGPLDPRLVAAGPPGPGTPPVIGAEEIRAFPAMARDWFGVTGEEGQRQLEILCARVFPTVLSQLHRADAQARRLAGRLLTDHLPALDAAGRAAIVERLVAGYPGHDDVIDRNEAAAVGLRVAPTSSPEEEDRLWDVWAAADAYVGDGTATRVEPDGPWRLVNALVAGRDVVAEHLVALGSAAEPALSAGAGWQLTVRRG